jgi:hypothetical protein
MRNPSLLLAAALVALAAGAGACIIAIRLAADILG